jgi:hypothetical protein
MSTRLRKGPNSRRIRVLISANRRYRASMGETWDRAERGVLELPSGRTIRGRWLGTLESSTPHPALGIYLTLRRPNPVPWDFRWLRWPDFWLPLDRGAAATVLREAWSRAESERVEVACPHGRGRTGTALACLAVLDGIPRDRAVDYVREHYSRHAAETPWQRRFVRSFPATSLDEFRRQR